MAAEIRGNDNFSGSGKRYFHRWPIRNRVLYRLADEAIFYEGSTNDLSCAGACVSVQKNFDPSQKVKLRIFFTDTVSADLEGAVMWNKKVEKGHQVGIFFSPLDKKTQELILQYAYPAI